MPYPFLKHVQSRAKRLCAKASGAMLSQASEHESDHGNENPGFFTAGEYFIVFGEPAPSR